MILSWGKPTIEKTQSVNKAVPAGAIWDELPTPRENTTQLIPSAGENVEAKEEGGDLVDVIYKKNSYTFEFEIFVKKGEVLPFTDADGVIAGEWALRLTPEDEDCEGILIPRCAVRAETTYTSQDGKVVKYTATPLKPATGNLVQPYTKGVNNVVSLSLDKGSIEMEDGDSVTLTATKTPSTASVAWATSDSSVATVNAGVVTGVAAGTAIITASVYSGGVLKTANCVVVVS